MTDEREPPGPDFFVSYAHENQTWAEWIAWQLEEAGYTTVLQAWDFTPASDWASWMQRATSTAHRTIAVLSLAYLQSVYSEAEWRVAFANDPAGDRGLLVPVRVENLRPPGLLQTRVYVDLVGLNESEAAARLLEAVSRDRGKPKRAPRFPGTRRVGGAPQFPAQGPAVTNLPARNPNFTGRQNLLESLATELRGGSPIAVLQARAIHGLGGVGKSELVLEYAHRYAADYELIWWIPSGRPARTINSLAALARRLHIDELAEQDEMTAELFDELRRRQRWLLIYDDAQEYEQLRKLLPAGGTGHVLITSRNRAWGRVADPLPLDVLRREESVRLLLRRTGRHDEVGAAAALAELLGDLPLALEEAAAYVEATGITLPQYLRLAREHTADLFGFDRPSGDEQRVATTWSVALERIAAQAPATEALLDLCSFLAPEDIPRELPTGSPERLPPPLAHAARDPLAYNEAVRLLGRYSLATVTPETLAVHLLVQVVVRARLSPSEEQRWTEAAIGLLFDRFPDESWEVRYWPVCQRLLPHVLTSTEHAERLGMASQEAGWLLDRASGYLLRRGQPQQALPIARRALDVTRSALGPRDPKTGERHDALGRVLRDLGKLEDAQDQLEQALGILQEARGDDHPQVAMLRGTCAQVLRRRGDLEGARELLERALVTLEAALGPDHTEVGNVHAEIAQLLWQQKRSVEAGERWARALAIVEGAYGTNHPSAATIRSNLSNVLQERRDLRGARLQLERALEAFEASLDSGHPETAMVRSKLGEVLRRLKDLPGARRVLEEGLTLSEEALGPDHPVVGILRGNLGQVLWELGELEAAQAQLRRAQALFVAVAGPDHENVAILGEKLRRVDRELAVASETSHHPV
ncbi:MAG TPA: FxSxx-COOH system tetratricopeptide repeat protein [Actinomycetes bacterium]|nr:FxSxx-COOH system tetratricopeptide repeat protein [Actinomycetes bacterium]